MTKQMMAKNIFFGFLSWLIPFVVSFLFYKPGGELIVSYGTFKSVMMVAGSASASYLLFRYFKFVNNNFIKNGVIVGLSWFLLNLVLDACILIPIMKISFMDYFISIGISYISIPAISTGMGYLLSKKLSSQ